MKPIMMQILKNLPPSIVSELNTLATNRQLPIDNVLTELLENSSHSTTSIERMSADHFREWIRKNETIEEIGRLCWHASWVA